MSHIYAIFATETAQNDGNNKYCSFACAIKTKKKMEAGCFIRKNTLEIRLALKEIGYDLCPCCEFINWDWLHTSEFGVHGIETVFSEEMGGVPSESFLLEDAPDYIDCGEDEEMFLKLAKEIYEKTKAR